MAKSALYKRIVGYLGDKFRPEDDELITLYCETQAFYKRMQKEIKDGDLLVEYTNKAGATNLIKNPLASEITKTVQVMNNLLKSLGLTAAQRKKVNSDDGGDKDEFENFPEND